LEKSQHKLVSTHLQPPSGGFSLPIFKPYKPYSRHHHSTLKF